MILGYDFIEERLFAANLNSIRKELAALKAPSGPVDKSKFLVSKSNPGTSLDVANKSPKNSWFRKKGDVSGYSSPSSVSSKSSTSKFDKYYGNKKYEKPSKSSYDDGYSIFDRPERMEYNPNNKWFRKKKQLIKIVDKR